MGWSRGADLFSTLIETIKDNVDDEATRYEIYNKMLAAFEDLDWDTPEECLGEDHVYDKLYEEYYITDDDDLENWEILDLTDEED